MIIKVLIDNNIVGVIQSFSLKTFPSSDKSPEIDISRMRLDKLKMGELFIRSFVHKDAQLVPVQIVVEDDGQEIFKIQNVWFEKIEKTFTANEWIIAEGVEAMAETVSGNFK